MTLEVNLENINAKHLYKKFGFTDIIRRIKDGNYETVILLKKL